MVIHRAKSISESSNRLRSLSKKVQQRLHRIQNPKKCRSSPKLLCDLNKSCGFACQIHHVIYCLLMAYYNNRTLILNADRWSYSSRGWTSVFQPLSDTCSSTDYDRNAALPANDLVHIPIVDALPDRPTYFPLSFPDDLAPELIYLHGLPPAWWIGQLASYIMRYQPQFEQELENRRQSIGFQNPIVGIHVRRTDKLMVEAKFHPLSQYMASVEEWYAKKILRNASGTKRRIYLATDDSSLLAEARTQYPYYEFIGDSEIAKSAAVHKRYSEESLQGIITDVHFLARCDYLVCTFSSQVGSQRTELGGGAFCFVLLEDDNSQNFDTLIFFVHVLKRWGTIIIC
ncbi:unnamed protein product [Soboliphyme baturini]|uniref:GT23 domain-containing protein n=1 Tax=Soboliphyme baturini TaxID=241478 RepID=A0A183J0R9_9BILA|nr:unnamed protein product [Soboliphyme baturini]